MLLDQYGKPMAPAPSKSEMDLSAYLDISYLTEENAEHWVWARHGDANTNLDYKRRFDARRRARYEVQNNNFLLGLTETIATDTIGPGGPVLEMQTGNASRDQEIEQAWQSWSSAIDLPNKLWTMIRAKVTDGETFGLMIVRDAVQHDIKLDLQVIEADQCGNPMGVPNDNEIYDGIQVDQHSMPMSYYFYDRHPFSLYYFPTGGQLTGQWYSPDRVIHLYKQGRPGQIRGVTELAAALPTAAIWRRWVLAVTLSAENVANSSLVMQTNSSAQTEVQPLVPLSTIPWPRNQMITLPEGWSMGQVKAEQPVDTFEQTDKCLKLDMARSLGVPAVLALLNSSEHNYSSARADLLPYYRNLDTTRVNQVQLRGLEKLFKVWVQFYADGGDVFDLTDTDIQREFKHRWNWAPRQPIDEEKQANAVKTLWEMNLVTDDDVLYQMGKDPATHYQQLAEQTERRKALGLPIPGVQPGMFEPSPQPNGA